MFIRTRDGLVNVNDVTKVEATTLGASVLKLRDGSSVVSDESLDDLARRIGPVIPESNGTQSLHMGFDGDEFYHFTQPVIGWVITANGPEPILCSGDQTDYVIFADGRVEHFHMRPYDNLEQAIEDFKRNR